MGIFGWIFGKGEDEPVSDSGGVPESYPWDDHPSIYEHIRSHIRPGEKQLVEGWEELPDEEALAARSEGSLRWAAGALDGVMGHHMGKGDDEQETEQAYSVVSAYCGEPTARNKAAVYEFLVEHETLSFIDPLIERVVEDPSINHQRLYDLAYSLATESPDRSPVKFGVAMLGLFEGAGNEELFHTLGRHDEFTLFCAVALSHASDTPEIELWTLAQNVDGWGRIQIVERLAETEDPRIKDWLLREGFKNSVMNEYLACICARSGGLLAALSEDGVDQELLSSAGDLLVALINGGPAEGMEDYEDGAAVVEQFLGHLESQATALEQLLSVAAIQRYVSDEEADWTARSERGWTPEKRAVVQEQCASIINRPHWEQRIVDALQSDDHFEFWKGSQAARVLGIDTWEHHWRRLQGSPKDRSCWYEVMSRCNEGRITEVIAFAEQQLPLEEVATGPSDELGLGPDYETHGCLDFILQELGQSPGQGTALVEAAMKSPVVRNRHGALRVLSAWGQDSWPPDIKPALEHAVSIEPDDEVRKNMKRLLSGETLAND